MTGRTKHGTEGSSNSAGLASLLDTCGGQTLFAHYHSGYAIAAYVLFCAILSLTSTTVLGDYTSQVISPEH